MGIFNRAIPKYIRNPIDNSISVEKTTEPVFIDDAFDPILNKAVREQLMSRYGNPITATLGGYSELISNALLGNKKQGGTMLPGIGILSSFGRTMDKAGDFILGGITEGVKGITGQGLESPFYNIFVEDEDYSGQRLFASAANSIAKLANAPELTEQDFKGGWALPALGVDLITDPSILGGGLTKIAKGTGAVADAGKLLRDYDDIMARFAIDASAPGLRPAAKGLMSKLQSKIMSNESFKNLKNVKFNEEDVSKAAEEYIKSGDLTPFNDVFRTDADYIDIARKMASEDATLQELLNMYDEVYAVENKVSNEILNQTDVVDPDTVAALQPSFAQDIKNTIATPAKNDLISSIKHKVDSIRSTPDINLDDLYKESSLRNKIQSEFINELYKGNIKEISFEDLYSLDKPDIIKPHHQLKQVGLSPELKGINSKEYNYTDDLFSQAFKNWELLPKEVYDEVLDMYSDYKIPFTSEMAETLRKKYPGKFEEFFEEELKDGAIKAYYAYNEDLIDLDAYLDNIPPKEMEKFNRKTLQLLDNSIKDSELRSRLSTDFPIEEHYTYAPVNSDKVVLSTSLKKTNPETTLKIGTKISDNVYNALSKAVKSGLITKEDVASGKGLTTLVDRLKQSYLTDENFTDAYKRFNDAVFKENGFSNPTNFKTYKTIWSKFNKKHGNIDGYVSREFMREVYRQIPEYGKKFYKEFLSEPAQILPKEISEQITFKNLDSLEDTASLNIISDYENLGKFLNYVKNNSRSIPQIPQHSKLYKYFSKNFVDNVLLKTIYKDGVLNIDEGLSELQKAIDKMIDSPKALSALDILSTSMFKKDIAENIKILENVDNIAGSYLKKYPFKQYLAEQEVIDTLTKDFDELDKIIKPLKGDITSDVAVRSKSFIDEEFDDPDVDKFNFTHFFNKSLERRHMRSPITLDELRKILDNKITLDGIDYRLGDYFEVSHLPKNIRKELFESISKDTDALYDAFSKRALNYEGTYFDKEVLKEIAPNISFNKFKKLKKHIVEFHPNKISNDLKNGKEIPFEIKRALETARRELSPRTGNVINLSDKEIKHLNIDFSKPLKVSKNTSILYKVYGMSLFDKFPTPKPEFKLKGKYVTLLPNKNKFIQYVDNVMGSYNINPYVEESLVSSKLLPNNRLMPTNKTVIDSKIDKFKSENVQKSITTLNISKNTTSEQILNTSEADVIRMPEEQFIKSLNNPEPLQQDIVSEQIASKIPEGKEELFEKIKQYVRMKMSGNHEEETARILESLEDDDEAYTLFKMIDSELNTVGLAQSGKAIEHSDDVKNIVSTASAIQSDVKYRPHIARTLELLDASRGDVLKGSDFINEILQSGGDLLSVYGKAESELANSVFETLSNNVAKVNKALGTDAFITTLKELPDGTTRIEVHLNSDNKRMLSLFKKIPWKKVINSDIGLEDVVFEPARKLTSEEVLFLNSKEAKAILNVLQDTQNIASDYYKKLGFEYNDPSYFKHTLIESSPVNDVLHKEYYSGINIKDINDISSAILDRGDLPDMRGTFRTFPTSRRFRGSISRYNRDGDKMFSTNLEHIVKSTFSKGIFSNTNFQTTVGIFFNKNFNVNTYCKSVDDVKKIFFAKDSKNLTSGNLQNLVLAAPKYDATGKIIGFTKFDVFNDASIAKALNTPNTSVLPVHTFSILDKICKHDMRMSNKLYAVVNRYITAPFKIGVLVNPSFLLGNFSDAYLKQATTLAQKHGTDVSEEMANVAESIRSVVKLNNSFDEIYQKVVTHLEESGINITKTDKISMNVLNNPNAKKYLIDYLNGTCVDLKNNAILSRLTASEEDVVRMWIYLNNTSPTGVVSQFTELEGFNSKYNYSKNILDRILYGKHKYSLKDLTTWGLLSNPLSQITFDSSNYIETTLRSASILNDLQHRGFDFEQIKKILANSKIVDAKESEAFHIAMVDAINTMHHANFNYSNTSKVLEGLETFIPFPTFWLKNIGYWLEAFIENPQIIDTYYAINEGLWANEDTSKDEFKADAKARGAVPLSAVHKPKSGQRLSNFFKGIYKPSPLQSMFSAFNAINHPIESLTQRVHPLIQGAGAATEQQLNRMNLTTNLFNPEDIRYRPYNANQYQPNINLSNPEFNPIEYTFHKMNPLDRTLNTGLRTPGKVKKGEAQLSDFLPSVFQPDFSKK